MNNNYTRRKRSQEKKNKKKKHKINLKKKKNATAIGCDASNFRASLLFPPCGDSLNENALLFKKESEWEKREQTTNYKKEIIFIKKKNC